MHILNCVHSPKMHSTTPMKGVGRVAGAGLSEGGNKVGVRESNRDGVCCVAETKRVVGCPVLGGLVDGGGSLGGFFDGLVGRRTLLGTAKPQTEASVCPVTDCLHEVDKSRDLVGRHLACFDMVLCIDTVGKAVPMNEPARAHFALPSPRYASTDILVCKSTSPSFAVLWLECVDWMLVYYARVDLSFFLFLSVVPVFLLLAFAFLFWGGGGIIGLWLRRFG